MKTNLKVLSVSVAVALALVMAGAANLTRAEDAKAPPSPEALLKALADAGQPGAEHKKLEPLVGDWTFTAKLWTDPSQPPAEFKGTVQRKWIMGGRFVQETAQGECHGETVEGLGLWGYDSGQKKFSTVRACGLCGTASHYLGSFDASGKRFQCETEDCCPLTGQKITGRDEVIIESNDKIVMNVYKTLDGKEVKTMECVSIRQK